MTNSHFVDTIQKILFGENRDKWNSIDRDRNENVGFLVSTLMYCFQPAMFMFTMKSENCDNEFNINQQFLGSLRSPAVRLTVGGNKARY